MEIYNNLHSSELKSFLTGLIIGDGHIDKGVTNRAFRMKSVNLDWAQQITNVLENANTFKVKYTEYPATIRNGVNRKAYAEVTTKAHPYFAKKYHHFYDDVRNRHVSSKAYMWIKDVSLAQWFMSDGYITLVGKNSGKIKDRRVEISTDRYSLEQVEGLRNMLYMLHDINTSKIKRGKLYRIRIKADSYEKFFNKILPYMVKSMMYKTNLSYPKKPRWMSNEFWKFQQSLTERDNPYYK